MMLHENPDKGVLARLRDRISRSRLAEGEETCEGPARPSEPLLDLLAGEKGRGLPPEARGMLCRLCAVLGEEFCFEGFETNHLGEVVEWKFKDQTDVLLRHGEDRIPRAALTLDLTSKRELRWGWHKDHDPPAVVFRRYGQLRETVPNKPPIDPSPRGLVEASDIYSQVEVALGVDHSGEEVKWRPSDPEQSHLLGVGSFGTGKSISEASVITQLASTGWGVVYLDWAPPGPPGHEESLWLTNWPNVTLHAMNWKDAANTLMLLALNLRNNEQDPGKEQPPMLLVLPNAAQFLWASLRKHHDRRKYSTGPWSFADPVRAALETILELGPKQRIHLHANAYPDDFSSLPEALIAGPTRQIALGVPSHQVSERFGVNPTYAEEIVAGSRPGVGFCRDGERTRVFKTPLMPGVNPFASLSPADEAVIQTMLDASSPLWPRLSSFPAPAGFEAEAVMPAGFVDSPKATPQPSSGKDLT